MNNFFNNTKGWIFLVVLVTAVLGTSFVLPSPQIAQNKEQKARVGSFGIPFGGPIVHLDFACAGGIAITLGPPTPGLYFYPYSARTFLFGPPRRVGQYTLGLSSPGGVCFFGKKSYPTQYTITMIGTSL